MYRNNAYYWTSIKETDLGVGGGKTWSGGGGGIRSPVIGGRRNILEARDCSVTLLLLVPLETRQTQTSRNYLHIFTQLNTYVYVWDR